MEKILIYPFQVLICSAILFGYYLLALRNKRFHYYNRFYLLAAFFISGALPLFKLEWFYVQPASNKTIAWLQAVTIPGTAVTPGFWEKYGNISTITFSLFFLVAFIGIFHLAWRIHRIFALRRQYPVQKMQDVAFIATDLPEAPFSFLQMLFWRKDISLQDETGQQVLKHELTHIREKHTWDKLFVQIMLCFYWYNPIFYLMQKELALVHEFIADEKAVADKGTAAFAEMLLHAKFGKNIFSPAQSFFYSPIKRRILMLTNAQKTRFSYLRRLMVLPLLAFIILLFAFKMKDTHATKSAEKFKLSEFHFSQDTIPTYGMYEGKKIYSVMVITAKQEVVIKLEDNTTRTMSIGEAAKLNIKIPPPPPPMPPAQEKLQGFYFTADSIILHKDKVTYNDVTIKGQLSKEAAPLYFLDGKIIPPESLQLTSPLHIQSIVVLKDAEAKSKYGDKGKNGVIELYTKSDNAKNADIAQENVYNARKTTSPNGIKVVDVQLDQVTPSFPGGQNAWITFLQQKLNMDLLVKAKAPVGTYKVIVSFTVEVDGHLTHIKALNDPGYGAAAEAVRVMLQSPNWIPAKENGKAIAMEVKQPFTFQVSE